MRRQQDAETHSNLHKCLFIFMIMTFNKNEKDAHSAQSTAEGKSRANKLEQNAIQSEKIKSKGKKCICMRREAGVRTKQAKHIYK